MWTSICKRLCSLKEKEQWVNGCLLAWYRNSLEQWEKLLVAMTWTLAFCGRYGFGKKILYKIQKFWTAFILPQVDHSGTTVEKVFCDLVYFSVVAERTMGSSRMNTWHVRSASVLSASYSIWGIIRLFSFAISLQRSLLIALKCISIHSPNFIV